MKSIIISLALLCALGLLESPTVHGQAISIATVPVGNPGNAGDPNGYFFGGVPYDYNIGKYDVTVGQYTAFLNAVAATDTYGLYHPNMATDLNVAGIQQNPTPSGFTYSVIGSANHPITYVSWGDAARFCNWLYNNQPTGAEGPGTTETGSYTLNGATTDAALNYVNRNANATWAIPTENEWHKAAFYNPGTGTYYSTTFSSDSSPTSAPPGSTPNTANFYGVAGYAVTGSTNKDPNLNYLTDVGAYTASASPYGAFDMGGNVWQWSETFFSGQPVVRLLHGSSWKGTGADLYGSSRSLSGSPGDDVGFRVALVPAGTPVEPGLPEPSTGVLAAFGGIAVVIAARRRTLLKR